jgi:hypothetical protein
MAFDTRLLAAKCVPERFQRDQVVGRSEGVNAADTG